MRLFFAAWPPPEAAHALSQWARAVHRDAGGRMMQTDNIHLTLAFLGEADPDRAAGAARQVRGIRHTLPIEQARYWKHNKILWVGPYATPPALEQLVAQLQASLKHAGFVLEDRPFAAHITLLRKSRPPQALPGVPAITWPVDEFLLVRSTTSRDGSRYDILQRFALC